LSNCFFFFLFRGKRIVDVFKVLLDFFFFFVLDLPLFGSEALSCYGACPFFFPYFLHTSWFCILLIAPFFSWAVSRCVQRFHFFLFFPCEVGDHFERDRFFDSEVLKFFILSHPSFRFCLDVPKPPPIRWALISTFHMERPSFFSFPPQPPFSIFPSPQKTVFFF